MTVLLYAAILGFMQVALAFLVISRRWKYKVAKGDGDVPELRQAIRVHGNFAEYTPIMLVLMLIAEQSSASATLLHSCGAMFLVGRLAHGFCFGFLAHSMPLRIGGMVLTLTALGSMAIAQLLALL